MTYGLVFGCVFYSEPVTPVTVKHMHQRSARSMRSPRSVFTLILSLNAQRLFTATTPRNTHITQHTLSSRRMLSQPLSLAQRSALLYIFCDGCAGVVGAFFEGFLAFK